MPTPLVPDLCRLSVGVVLLLPDVLDEFARGRRAGSAPGSADGSSAESAIRAIDRATREALLQCHLFCGFPRTIAALDHLRAAGLPLAEATDGGAAAGTPEGGADLFDRIYGDGATDVRAHLRALDPDLEAMVAGHAYGAVLSRGGLDAGARELLAVVMLAATGHDRQLASHVRGAIRCGVAAADLHAALDAVQDLVGTERMARARDVAARFSVAE